MPALIRAPAVSREDAVKIISRTNWFHRIEVIDGLVTPGVVPPAPEVHRTKEYMDGLGFGPRLAGIRVLDVGTYDGPMAFELAQRGAEVVAVDIKNASETGFSALREISGIYLRHVQADVDHINEYFEAEFDIVLFLGVFYHLKNPVVAFENIARTLKPEGLLYTEGASFHRHFEDLDGAPLPIKNLQGASEMLDDLDAAGIPISLAYPGTYMRGNNWFLPNRSALKGWIRSAGLNVDTMYAVDDAAGGRRLGVRARKI